MADQNVTELSEDTAPSLTDLIYGVKDPASTPLDRKLTWETVQLLLKPTIIVDQGIATVVTLVATDLNKTHLFKNTTSCVITFPTVTSSNKGAHIQCRKKGIGDIDIKRGGTNTFIDNATHFANTNASQTYSYITLIADTATNWGISAMLGDWSSS